MAQLGEEWPGGGRGPPAAIAETPFQAIAEERRRAHEVTGEAFRDKPRTPWIAALERKPFGEFQQPARLAPFADEGRYVGDTVSIRRLATRQLARATSRSFDDEFARSR